MPCREPVSASSRSAKRRRPTRPQSGTVSYFVRWSSCGRPAVPCCRNPAPSCRFYRHGIGARRPSVRIGRFHVAGRFQAFAEVFDRKGSCINVPKSSFPMFCEFDRMGAFPSGLPGGRFPSNSFGRLPATNRSSGTADEHIATRRPQHRGFSQHGFSWC